MKEQDLQALYEEQDQGTYLIYCAISWALYLAIISVSDFVALDTVFSALTRIGAILCLVIALFCFWLGIPRELLLAKSLVVLFATIGIVLQLLVIGAQMEVRPDISNFLNRYYLAQFVLSLGLFPMTYCVRRLTNFPLWLGIALYADCVFWIIYYVASVFEVWYDLMEALAWGPSLLIEFLTGIFIVKIGIHKQRSIERPAR